MAEATYKIRYKDYARKQYEDGYKVFEWTISQILEEINRDRSAEWTDYDKTDWREGLEEFTDFECVQDLNDVYKAIVKLKPEAKSNLNFYNDALFVNCADTQAITINKGNCFQFNTVGGSRYCWLQTFYNPEECAKFVIDNILSKDSEQIDQEYKKVWSGLC